HVQQRLGELAGALRGDDLGHRGPVHQRLAVLVHAEGRLTLDGGVEGGAEGEHVGGGGRLCAAGHLGRQVGGGAGDDAVRFVGGVACPARDAEVAELGE